MPTLEEVTSVQESDIAVREAAREAPQETAGKRAFLEAYSGPSAWKDALRRRVLAAADLTTVLVGASAAALVSDAGLTTALWVAALVPLWFVLAKVGGLYGADHIGLRHQTVDEIARLFNWVLQSVAATALVLTLGPDGLISPAAAVAMFCASLPAAVALRAGARAAWRRAMPAEPAVLIGGDQLGDAIVRKLVLEPGHSIDIKRRVEIERNGHDSHERNGRARAIGPDELHELLRETRSERVIVAVNDLDEASLADIVSSCRELGVKLSVAPPLRAMLGTAVKLNHLAELPLIEFRTWDASRTTMFAKRTMDLVGAGLMLVVLSPVMLLIAGVIRLDSPGRALFRQVRAGRDGKPFTMLKFRTMVGGAEQRVEEVIDLAGLADPMFKLRHDPRTTRVGRFLRRTSLDELPQLLNVLRGDMSLVGPRPEESWLVDRWGEAERARLQMRPGITGPMQVHGRGELTYQERLAVEREYVENYSLPKDLKILMRTLAVVWRGDGAF